MVCIALASNLKVGDCLELINCDLTPVDTGTLFNASRLAPNCYGVGTTIQKHVMM